MGSLAGLSGPYWSMLAMSDSNGSRLDTLVLVVWVCLCMLPSVLRSVGVSVWGRS